MDFDSHGISRPGSIEILTNGNIAVADGQIKKITIVTSDGDSVAQFGKEGRGPAEFIYPGNLTVASGLLNIVDANQFKVLEFDLDGNFVDSYGYESKAMGGAIALSDDREFFTGANGENEKLIKWSKADADTSLLFGEAKISLIEDMDMEASRNDIANGRVPDYFKNNVTLIAGTDHLYAFLSSFSELRKYTMSGELVWQKQVPLPDNDGIQKGIADAAKNMPNALPFVNYAASIKLYNDNLFILGGKARDKPQHITEIDPNGNIVRFIQLASPDFYFMDFVMDRQNELIYLSDMQSGLVYKTRLSES